MDTLQPLQNHEAAAGKCPQSNDCSYLVSLQCLRLQSAQQHWSGCRLSSGNVRARCNAAATMTSRLCTSTNGVGGSGRGRASVHGSLLAFFSRHLEQLRLCEQVSICVVFLLHDLLDGAPRGCDPSNGCLSTMRERAGLSHHAAAHLPRSAFLLPTCGCGYVRIGHASQRYCCWPCAARQGAQHSWETKQRDSHWGSCAKP